MALDSDLSDNFRLRRGVARTGFGDDHDSDFPVILYAENRRAAFQNSFNMCDMKLYILRKIVLAMSDDQVFAATCNIEPAIC